MKIAVDFDGTIVEQKKKKIGRELPFATQTLRQLIKDHHQLILWTVREGQLLDEAIEWCRERGVEFWAVNKDFPEEDVTKNHNFSRKIKADVFIYQMITEHKSYRQIIRGSMGQQPQQPQPKRHWWNF